MSGYILRRLGNIVVVLLGLTLFTFILLRIAPGSPVYFLMGEQPSPEKLRELEHELGFDRPLPVQYLDYIGSVVRGDLGTSIAFGQPAATLVLERLPATLELTLCSLVLVLAISIPVGVLVAIKRSTVYDRVGSLVALLGISVPSFWLGIMLILLFAVGFGWFSASGRGPALLPATAGLLLGETEPFIDSIRRLALPTVTLAAFEIAFLTRLTRGTLLEELSQNYLRAARARGLPRWFVIAKHGLRNALLPVITVLGLEIGTLIGGAIITETVFAWPGVGQLLYQAVSSRDYALAQAGILIIGTFVVFMNFLVDLSYGLIDPRVRYG
jgi:ABC-type dipeptide/oligopeptide/nickel transport system permease component